MRVQRRCHTVFATQLVAGNTHTHTHITQLLGTGWLGENNDTCAAAGTTNQEHHPWGAFREGNKRRRGQKHRRVRESPSAFVSEAFPRWYI